MNRKEIRREYRDRFGRWPSAHAPLSELRAELDGAPLPSMPERPRGPLGIEARVRAAAVELERLGRAGRPLARVVERIAVSLPWAQSDAERERLADHAWAHVPPEPALRAHARIRAAAERAPGPLTGRALRRAQSAGTVRGLERLARAAERAAGLEPGAFAEWSAPEPLALPQPESERIDAARAAVERLGADYRQAAERLGSLRVLLTPENRERSEREAERLAERARRRAARRRIERETRRAGSPALAREAWRVTGNPCASAAELEALADRLAREPATGADPELDALL